MAMSCDSGWKCVSKTGKYSIETSRCRYANSIGSLNGVTVDGKKYEEGVITASYDSLSIGGDLLNIEVNIYDENYDAHYLAFEFNGSLNKGTVTERIQQYNPGRQTVISSEEITCKVVE